VATAWEGEGAIAKARSVMGATNSPEAAQGTLRREFGTNNRYNVVHGSDSAASAEREIQFFFKPDELHTYHGNDWKV
jgi:nucleoside-diphosphate kinase